MLATVGSIVIRLRVHTRKIFTGSTVVVARSHIISLHAHANAPPITLWRNAGWNSKSPIINIGGLSFEQIACICLKIS
ncbi:hypothetical protein EG68_01550 [Paragonimus skrjabini miyazakii]|uniref:Uncharacterized protein n=1 Tax=Paragonimus skrjabini miyazakii TaxID=59628 RepID=A0A8S9Z0Z7_9TREM|nr:hypothetical protein EG68_01550 [Paragonimus skrjabini miyazakii]